MLNKSNVREKAVFLLGYTLVMGLIMLALMGCSSSEDDNSGGDDPGTGPPPPPPWTGCDFPETEFNDTWQTPNFVTTLPIIGEQQICGEITGATDVDNFYFFLSPEQGQETVPINFYVETAPETITDMKLVRPLYNKHGQPTGDYDVIWYAISWEGEILIVDLDLEYDDTLLFDLILEIRQLPFSATSEPHEYTINFWSN